MGSIITKITSLTRFNKPVSNITYQSGNTEKIEENWFEDSYAEGQLAIDVYHTPTKLIINSTIAGAKPEDIDISLNNDMLTIRGKREMPGKIETENYLHRECYWGPFSRSIILPFDIYHKNIKAALENGILTVTLTKAKKELSIKVKEK
ncbi:MAG: Hsp20/alpha crystallin family protein [Patescibacteria group bacterium]